MITVRAYQPEIDFESVFELWQTTMKSEWQLDQKMFNQLIGGAETYPSDERLVACAGNEIVGFVATQTQPSIGQANLTLLMVATTQQSQNIGRQLHEAALQHLATAQIKRVQLGGGSPRIWPGVPTELEQASNFFLKQGWEYSEKSFDLTQDLNDYHPPAEVYNRPNAIGTTFHIATLVNYDEIRGFQIKEFPQWEEAYIEVMELGDYNDILLVRNKEGELVGALIMYSTASNQKRTDVNWKISFGRNAGGIGCVGIAKAVEGQGLGSAMVAHASEILSRKGVSICLIGWTNRVNFYKRVGYQNWKAYQMSWRDL